jgi:hypothetical protein
MCGVDGSLNHDGPDGHKMGSPVLPTALSLALHPCGTRRRCCTIEILPNKQCETQLNSRRGLTEHRD